MIWFVAPDTYAASNAATSGAFVLSESYLYTEEMIAEAYDHLTPDGMVVTQFGDFDFDERPTRTARYLVTAREALRSEQTDFSRQTALLVNRGDVDLDRFSTMLLFKNPPEDDASTRLLDSLTRVPDTEALHLPDRSTTGGGITTDIITGSASDVEAIVDGYEFDISSIDDDRPFFWHFTPFSDVVGDWSRSYADTEIAIGERLLIVLIGIAFVVSSAFLWLPFVLTRRRGQPPRRVEGRGRMFVYFASIGLGFMLVEISMIQRFSLLLGYPTLSLSVSLFTLLLATAIGARLSGRIGARPASGLPGAVVALFAVTLLYLTVSGPITEVALAWGEPLRIMLVFAMLFPVGMALGVFLPAGIDQATRLTSGPAAGDRDRFVAWCWAVNGFFSVIGSSLTTVASMTFGFDRTVMFGLALYVVALAALLVGRRAPATMTSADRAEPPSEIDDELDAERDRVDVGLRLDSL